MNTLYYGDNLDILREHIADESIDLVYLDPPFNSNANYNVIFREHKGGEGGQAQITAFKDTWVWGIEAEQALADLLRAHGRLAEFMDYTVRFLNKNSLSAYLVMMSVRLVELHRVLKDTGSLYLHCDPTASHYLKMILDIVFEPQNFRAEITWKRSSAHSDAKQGRKAYGNITDIIFYYSKSDDYTFNVQYTPYDQSYVDSSYRHIDENGRRYRLDNMTGPGGAGKGNPSYEVMGVTRYWRYSQEKMNQLIAEGRVIQTKPGNVPQYKRYLDEMPGVSLQNLWTDIQPVGAQAKERLGYPTQKPIALLKRIIEASSNPGDVVLDPFCGCGTAIVAAHELGRKWIGVDITHLSVALMQNRLKRDFDLKPGKDYAIEGTPRDVEAARYLFEQDAFQFQYWAVSLINAQPYGASSSNKKGKKGGDTGIDGKLYYRTAGGERLETGIVSVKGGKNLNPAMVRDLVGTVTREKAALGVLILLEEPTKGMTSEAAKGGTLSYGGQTYPKIQILTVAELLSGKTPAMPQSTFNVSLEAKPAKTLENDPRTKNQPYLFSEQDE